MEGENGVLLSCPSFLPASSSPYLPFSFGQPPLMDCASLLWQTSFDKLTLDSQGTLPPRDVLINVGSLTQIQWQQESQEAGI